MLTSPTQRLAAGLLAVLAAGQLAQAGEAQSPACQATAVAGTELTLVNTKQRLTLVELTPNPASIGPNIWAVRLTAADGRPLSGARLSLHPFMDAHGHGTVPDHFDAKEESPGLYRAGPFELFMPGDWRVEIRYQQAGHAPTKAVFHACVLD